LSKYFNNFHFF